MIALGSFEGYKQRFEEVSAFFSDRLDEARTVSSELIGILATQN